MRLTRLILAILPLVACTTTGCAAFAKRPPSPATLVLAAELERTTPTPPGERYFALVYGSQSTPKVPKYTHTWATVVRTSAATETSPGTILEHHTISWMPATLDIQTKRFAIEPGVNLGLVESLDVMFGFGERVSVWGPYEIRAGLYQKGVIQKTFMESGQMGYQCIDTIGEAASTGLGCNCVHALSDADARAGRAQYPLTKYGESASERIVGQLHLADVVQNPGATHDWILQDLGINHYPIVRRTYTTRPLEELIERIYSRIVVQAARVNE